MKHHVLVSFFVFFYLSVNFVPGDLQTLSGFDKKYERAEQLYKGGSYNNALEVYSDLYKGDTSNMNLCFKIGDCYLKTGKNLKRSLYFLQKAANAASPGYKDGDVKERKAPIYAFKLLGDALHLNYDFDKAILAYIKFNLLSHAHSKAVTPLEKEVERQIRICNYAKELFGCPNDVSIINLGKSINSTYADYAPRISADQSTMIFTSKRPENIGGRTYGEGQYFEDIYISTKKNGEWQAAVNIGPPVNTVGNEAAIAISADGQEILIYKDDLGDGNIYSSKLEGENWSVPKKLNTNINSKWWEPAAYVSADGNTLYFVSDRPGGYGGSDIYKSKKMSNGEWGRAVNLGPRINTAYDEHSPYIHPDGRTLFFSSKGHKTMGGFDVFFSRMLQTDERAWSEPVNIGYPINTTGDDAFYIVSPDKTRAYYATTTNETIGEKDIYMVTFREQTNSPLALVKGVVVNAEQKVPQNVLITITDNESNEVLARYQTNSKSGKYSFILTPGKNHNINYEAEGYLFYSENRKVTVDMPYFETDLSVKLEELAVGSKVVLNNIFFDFDKIELRPSSKVELNKLYDFLLKHPGLKVEIAGFADARGREDYNKKLSLDRAKAVVGFLCAKGIAKERIRAVGYGSGLTENNQSDAPETHNQYFRRVELKITGL
jgi:outer membrane protein OmpA-like peptidoglycan-associated protein